MKALLLTLVSIFFIQTAFAKTPEISACTERSLVDLKESIAEQKKDYPNVKLMKNEKSEIVGYFAWADDNDSTFFSEICESMWIDEDITAADKWYYWQNDGIVPNPAQFEAGETYFLAQDEGLAKFKVLKTSAKGNIIVEFTVLGWDSEGEEKTLRTSVLKFTDL